MTNLKNYIRVYDDILDSQTCKLLINKFNENTDLQERYEHHKSPQFTQLNITTHQNEIGTDLHQILVQKSVQCLIRYREELNITYEFPTEYSFEHFRMKKYYHERDDEFQKHVDVGDYKSAKRFLVFFFYLNDVKTGGETQFINLGYRVKPKVGRCLIFPPLWLFPHSGNIPRGTDKYIVGSYLHYT
jgi:hypothetical protein